jgi:baseplate J-like protein
MNLDRCGCCEGTHGITPVDASNRPGLTRLAYRVGTHGSFLETMKARLSSIALEIADPATRELTTVAPLQSFTTREENDPSIALLDAWATTASVLTFYQERIANEGFLRTATERRSLVELARLVGYAPRPGVASSVYLGFILQKTTAPPAPPLPGVPNLSVPQPMASRAGTFPAGGDEDLDISIPAGTAAQSIPGPGELPQTFETGSPLVGRVRWNNLKPRQSKPAAIGTIRDNGLVTLDGTNTYLSPNDPLVIVSDGVPEIRRVTKVTPYPAVLPWEGKTVIEAQPWLEAVTAPTPKAVAAIGGGPFEVLDEVLSPLEEEPSSPPSSPLDLDRSVGRSFDEKSDAGPRLLAALHPELRKVIDAAWSNALLSEPPDLTANALRVKASLFGHNAPSRDTEKFSVSLSVDDVLALFHARNDVLTAGAQFSTTLTVEIGTVPKTATIDLQVGSQSIPFPEAGETLVVDISVSSASRGAISIEFKQRGFVLTISVDISTSKGAFGISAIGSDPTDVEIGRVGQEGGGLVVSGTLSRAFSVNEQPDVISLDASYPKILPGSIVVVDRPDVPEKRFVLIGRVESVTEVSRADYGLSGATTQITLADDVTHIAGGATNKISLIQDLGAWFGDPTPPPDFSFIRETTVYALSDELALAEEAIDPEEEPIEGDSVELDGLYGGLQSGRWIIVAGERTDVDVSGVTVPGVMAAEVAMLAAVEQPASDLQGDTVHTVLRLANPLAYKYRRDSVTIYGNVAEATHGVTRTEVLGGGDSSVPSQQFQLHQPPLTYVAAPVPSGVQSTLQVRVNDILWHSTDQLITAGPTDHDYSTRTDDDDTVRVLFGDGRHGARPPRGAGNISATYRAGIGRAGNVPEGQISQLVTRPLGVNGVTNPIPATGGSDRDSQASIRKNAPLVTMALDHLVSVQDYQDFAQTFAGIGKASAQRLPHGGRQVVHITVAGVDDIPISTSSELYRNLLKALRDFGDPNQMVEVAIRSLMYIIIAAGVRVDPDFRWASVEPAIRGAMLDAFGFERRTLGQPVWLGEVLATMQSVPGVLSVDLDVLDAVRQSVTAKELASLAENLTVQDPIQVHLAAVNAGAIAPAELALLTPEVADTLILRELPA